MGYVSDKPHGCDREVRRACEMFARFHGRTSDVVRRSRVVREMPRVIVELGELRGLIYRSDKWGPGAGRGGRARTYIHFMRTPATLACDAGGTRLFILGGDYRVTRRGIEG